MIPKTWAVCTAVEMTLVYTVWLNQLMTVSTTFC